MAEPLVEISTEDRPRFGRVPLLGRHRLHELDLFSDEALIELLDGFPRENLFALSMGYDLRRPEENRLALHDGVSGADLLKAVKRGRLWLNVTRVDRVDRRFRDLIDQLYVELEKQCPEFHPSGSQGTLLISSPEAMVYYHADGPPTLLWHIRGRKRVWMYPALDERFAARDALEDIFAGVGHEYLPYRPELDDGSVSQVLDPGQLASWPQNAPHRVTNLDSVNVSLTTEHFTKASRSRARLFQANRFLRCKLGIRPRSINTAGPAALAKTALHRAARAMGMDVNPPKRHVPSLRVDPTAPLGCVPLEPPPAQAARPS
jgi:hypothetical protein